MDVKFYTIRDKAFPVKWVDAISMTINDLIAKELNRWLNKSNIEGPVSVKWQPADGIYYNRLEELHHGNALAIRLKYDQYGLTREITYGDKVIEVIGNFILSDNESITMKSVDGDFTKEICKVNKLNNVVTVYKPSMSLGISCTIDPDNLDYYIEFIYKDDIHNLKPIKDHLENIIGFELHHIDGMRNVESDYVLYHDGKIHTIPNITKDPDIFIADKRFQFEAFDDMGVPYRIIDIDNGIHYEVTRGDRKIHTLNHINGIQIMTKVVSHDWLHEYTISTEYTTKWLSSSFHDAMYDENGILKEFTIGDTRYFCDMIKRENAKGEIDVMIRGLNSDVFMDRTYYPDKTIIERYPSLDKVSYRSLLLV